MADQPHSAGQHHRVHWLLADHCAGQAEALLQGVQQAQGGVRQVPARNAAQGQHQCSSKAVGLLLNVVLCHACRLHMRLLVMRGLATLCAAVLSLHSLVQLWQAVVSCLAAEFKHPAASALQRQLSSLSSAPVAAFKCTGSRCVT